MSSMARVFPVILDDNLNRKIEEYMLKHEFRTKRECIIELIKKGLDMENEPETGEYEGKNG